MPVRLRPEDRFPGDNVASSIQACEACRVGASPTHLTSFNHAHGKVDEPSVCKTDLTRCESGVRVQFHSIQAEIALRSVGIGQKAGASPADGSLYRSEVQMASRLAHNQEIVSSILTAANFIGTLRGPTARRLSHKEETVGRHHPERFSFTGSAYWQTVHPTLNR